MAKEAGYDDFGDMGSMGTPAAYHTHHFSSLTTRKLVRVFSRGRMEFDCTE